tara:strand:- start:49 stop:153 length:105 start_codon:yes stop_codon:yes gene_type:complete
MTLSFKKSRLSTHLQAAEMQRVWFIISISGTLTQ